MRVVPLGIGFDAADRVRGAGRALAAEVMHAVGRYAAPLVAVLVVAIFAAVYLSLDDGGGGKMLQARQDEGRATPDVTPPVTPTATPIATPTVTPTVTPTLSVTPIVTLIEPSESSVASSDEPSAQSSAQSGEGGDEAAEIEMDAIDVSAERMHRQQRRQQRQQQRQRAEGPPARAERAAGGERKKSRTAVLAAAARQKVAPAEQEQAVDVANVANRTSARASGKLAVTSNVPALIYIDGRSTRMMTPKRLTVPAGPHKVTLLEPTSRKARTQDVEIVAGKTVAIEKRF